MVNDMAERFEKLFILPSDLYSEGSPIIISAGALLKDTETGKVIAQIKYHSISSTPIKDLKIKSLSYMSIDKQKIYNFKYKYA